MTHGVEFSGMLGEFAECVLYRAPGKHAHKFLPQWDRGVILGKTEESDEFLISASSGVVAARTVRKMSEESRYSLDLLSEFRGLPWD
eukprot:11799457-Alexandrium_andersonii.AAC.1